MNKLKKTIFFLLIVGTLHNTYSQNFSKRKINNLKTQVSQMVEDDKKATQVMVDKVFSFAELGFQEFETSNTEGDYTLTFAFDVEEETASTWSSFFSEARACSSRSFSASAEACIDETMMAVQGVVEIRESTSDALVSELDFDGSFLVIGYVLDNGSINLTTDTGSISLNSNDGSNFVLNSAEW